LLLKRLEYITAEPAAAAAAARRRPLRSAEIAELLPKLKNCAEAGPAIPTSSASATASATSGPGSVNTRRKDFVFGMRLDPSGSHGYSL